MGDFLLGEKDIKNKAGQPIGAAGTEDRHFRECFWGGPICCCKIMDFDGES